VNVFGGSTCNVGRPLQQTHHDVTVPDTLFPHSQYLRFYETFARVGDFVHFVHINYTKKFLIDQKLHIASDIFFFSIRFIGFGVFFKLL